MPAAMFYVWHMFMLCIVYVRRDSSGWLGHVKDQGLDILRPQFKINGQYTTRNPFIATDIRETAGYKERQRKLQEQQQQQQEGGRGTGQEQHSAAPAQ